MMPIVEIEGLSHSFGAFTALRDLSLSVPSGAVYGFLGPNGSGKTTTIRILLGLLRPQTGHVSVLGRPMPGQRRAIARHVGSMVETPCLYDHLSGYDNVDLTRRAMGLPRSETERVLGVVELWPYAERRAGRYSLGMRQRLGIARALLGRPKLLVLDEPTNGLDPAGVLDMRRLIRELPGALGVTVFVSSHMLNEIEQVASHVGLMSKGQLIVQSTLPELMASVPSRLAIGVRDAERAVARLRAAGVDCALGDDGLVSAALNAGCGPDPAEMNALLVRDGFGVFSLHISVPTLEAIFMQRTAATA
jgi:ABC-2 type transport system ATP-binding protein